MPRNPGNADKLMLEEAKKIIAHNGCSGLRIRDVADRAGVNLGMFHYHFKSKEHFKRLALQEIYEAFFKKLTKASKEGNTPLKQLKNTLFAMACFIRDERDFYVAIFKDLFNEDPDVFYFVGKNVPRHSQVISDLLSKCQAEGSIIDIGFHEAMPVLMGAIVFPILMGTVVEKQCKKHRFSSRNREFLRRKEHFYQALTDKLIKQRLDIALKGLAP